jgi:hypothetical protein
MALAQGLMDFRDTAVISVAPLPNGSENVEPKFVRGQGESPCEFRAVGLPKVWTAPVETAANLQGES